MKKSEVEIFFDNELKHLKFDRKLIKKLNNFRLLWSTKSDEYLDFLGSNLFGVHTIRFSAIDERNLYNLVYGIENPNEMQKRLYEVEGIEKSFNVTSNLINHLLTYTMYRFHHSDMRKRDKKQGIIEACLIMQYRFTASIFYDYFKYTVKESIAITLYERLSHKYLIKQLGSWQAVFLHRAKSCTEKNEVNYRKLDRYTTEDAVRVISDIQTKVRRNIVNMYSELVKVIEEDNIVQQSNATFLDLEGEKIVADVSNLPDKMIHTITLAAYNESEFLDRKINAIILNIFPNIKERNLIKFIKDITDKDMHRDDKKYYKLLGYDKKETPDLYLKVLEDIIKLNVIYLQRMNININDLRNIGTIISLVKNYWSSGRVTDQRVKNIKRYLIIFARNTTGVKTNWFTTTLAISFILYIQIKSLKV